ncbi:ATP synthase epsilon subunit [Mycoplasmopsis citelli]|uniref:ATP synthase epsilon chain n=1 Tax=Mycoplasmopsis citelli TaxID=171281 RepID=A0A449B1F0_9BACT|nr:ATP synthase F1 subunit epsilon [Mycoplasmopsis citelli]VEU74428.1 ATP synthase epsilon subunit [Mycoplasmopsis citelli]
MANKTYLTITTPNKVFFSGETEIVTLKIADGYIGIMPNITPIFSSIETGKLTIGYLNDSNSIKCYIGSGLIYADKDKVNIITDDIIKADDIDLERAKKDLAFYEEAISKAKATSSADTQKFEVKLKKAISRIDIYNQFHK